MFIFIVFYYCYMLYGFKNVLYLMYYVIIKSIFRPEKSPCEVMVLWHFLFYKKLMFIVCLMM